MSIVKVCIHPNCFKFVKFFLGVYGIGDIVMKKFCRYGSFDENDCRYGSVREGAMYEQPDDSGGRAWLHVCPLIAIMLIMQIVMPPSRK